MAAPFAYYPRKPGFFQLPHVEALARFPPGSFALEFNPEIYRRG
jgi:hypothetical protein